MHKKNMSPRICSISTVAYAVTTFWLDQLCFMQQQGFSVSVVCSFDPILAPRIRAKLHCQFIEMERGVSFLSTLKNIGQLFGLLRRERYDMIQYTTPKAALVAAIAGFFARVPVRLYCQWGIRYVGFCGWKRWVFKSLERLTCVLSTHISPDSYGNFEFSVHEGLYRADKASVVYHGSANGVNLQVFNPAVRERFRNKTRENLSIGAAVLFGWVGRITRDKGVCELVEAFRILIENGFNGKLVMIGEYESNHGLPEATMQVLRDHPKIQVLGKRDEMAQYYAAMDIVVLPSYREGFGTFDIE